MSYEVLVADGKLSEAEIREGLKRERPNARVERIAKIDGEWNIRIADLPPFMKEKADEAAPSDSPSDAPSDDASSDSDSDSDGDKPSDSKGDGKEKSKGADPVQEVKGIIDQLTSLFTDLGGKVEDLKAQHDEKDQKLKEISDTVGDAAGLGGGDTPPPPLPPDDAAPPPPAANKEGVPPVPRGPRPPGARPRPGAPMQPGGGPPVRAFTHKLHEVATHPGTDESGQKISLVAAAASLEADPEWADYEVVGMVENRDGTLSAKMRRKHQ